MNNQMSAASKYDPEEKYEIIYAIMVRCCNCTGGQWCTTGLDVLDYSVYVAKLILLDVSVRFYCMAKEDGQSISREELDL